MILLIERCLGAGVSVDGVQVSRTGRGLAVFAGVETNDTREDAVKAAAKICGMRIFENESGKMDLCVTDVRGEILLVSNFTLCGDASHGRRPDFTQAARPENANALYLVLAEELAKTVTVKCGVFGADMKVAVENDGPVNIIYETGAKRKE